jgi:hypothetical protein
MSQKPSTGEAPVNVICLKYGTRYPAHYVNNLYAGVRRHLSRPHVFHCCTDDPTGIHPGVNIIPFPENPGITTWWPHVLVKLCLIKPGFGNLSGPTLFLDLDVVIMDGIDCFFDHEPGKNCMIHNWVNGRKNLLGNRPPVGNSSIFRFNAGDQSSYIYETFMRELHLAENTSVYNTEQAFLTHAMEEVKWWPDDWVKSYKWHCRLIFPLNLFLRVKKPKSCRILVFHGRPDPDEAISGYRGKSLRHHILPSPWIADYWHERKDDSP